MESPWQAGTVGQIDHDASLIRHGGECYPQSDETASAAGYPSNPSRKNQRVDAGPIGLEVVIPAPPRLLRALRSPTQPTPPSPLTR